MNKDDLHSFLENYYDDPEYVAITYYNKALEDSIDEIKGWEELLILNYETGIEKKVYKFPKEAKREYNNQLNLLNTIKNKLKKKRVKQ